MGEERTLAIIKPDAFRRKIVGQIINRIERKGFKIVALRACFLTQHQARKFYAVHKNKPFFNSLVRFITSGPIVVLTLQGYRVIESYRQFIGATDPAKAKYGTIRREFGTSIEQNVVHASDAPRTAKIEIAFFFQKKDFIE